MADSLAMGNLLARWNEEPSVGTSQQTQGKCNSLSSAISVVQKLTASPGDPTLVKMTVKARDWMGEIIATAALVQFGMGRKKCWRNPFGLSSNSNS